ncbi:aminotransferase class IV [Corynebacterium sp. TAE3-ERU12]|uniref:aminotransferase class IV n=1 Tax=Corynebacterium sp. TAE3-ERU12 TaxID=2849491 RepID=UPI001C4460EC|nr:aminotransferase class IV [Corynebacterium sp. TAE3-ERU12]MBV7295475.1 aminotransferase class IV [Corynebacterium sp. TAE3-ERU12]
MSTFAWDGTQFVPASTPSGKLRVADSWRQTNGHVRRIDLHQQRFSHSTAQYGYRVNGSALFTAAVELIPAEGEWFPRLSLVEDTVYLDIRPGPERRQALTVQVLPPGDPRTNPRVKGPDLARTGALIADAAKAGAHEVLFRDEQGLVLEAGYAALVWWDGEALCVPTPELPVLPSVTRLVVEQRAHELGVPVRQVAARLAELDGCEAWLLNAYQGIRYVTDWVGADITPGAPQRFTSWREFLDGQLTPVHQ